MDIVDLLIHVKPPLTGEDQMALEEQLRSFEGIIAPRFNLPGAALLSVAYNPDLIGSQGLLHAVRAAGYQASLVGL